MSSVGACAAGLPRLLSGQLAVRLPDGAPHCTARRAEELAGLAEELAARDLEEALELHSFEKVFVKPPGLDSPAYHCVDQAYLVSLW